MSKIIKVTDQYLNEARSEFEELLKTVDSTNGKISFSKQFCDTKEKANLYFTESAYIKMTTLIREFNKEIAWHGVASRTEDVSENGYLISDIVVYPQTVSKVHVDMDTEEYAKWICENYEDERFNHLYMQGHSHVDMGVTPSNTDSQHQQYILDMLGDDDFYIFLICNKQNDITIRIYDLEKNTLFETSDVTVSLIDDGMGLKEFVKKARELVRDEKPASYPKSYNYNSYYGSSWKPIEKEDKPKDKDSKPESDSEKKKASSGLPAAKPKKKKNKKTNKNNKEYKPYESHGIYSSFYDKYPDDDFYTGWY